MQQLFLGFHLGHLGRSYLTGLFQPRSPSSALFTLFWGEGSPTKIDYRKKGTLIGISATQLLASGSCAPRASLIIHVPVKRPPSSLPCCSTGWCVLRSGVTFRCVMAIYLIQVGNFFFSEVTALAFRRTLYCFGVFHLPPCG